MPLRKAASTAEFQPRGDFKVVENAWIRKKIHWNDANFGIVASTQDGYDRRIAANVGAGNALSNRLFQGMVPRQGTPATEDPDQVSVRGRTVASGTDRRTSFGKVIQYIDDAPELACLIEKIIGP